jgi:hypothetical protein
MQVCKDRSVCASREAQREVVGGCYQREQVKGLEISVSPIRDRGGSLVCVVGSAFWMVLKGLGKGTRVERYDEQATFGGEG